MFLMTCIVIVLLYIIPINTSTHARTHAHTILYKVFLHVNEVNDAALRLYERCGYDEAPDCASNRAFTNSLGLAGGFIGQRHLLLHKTFQNNIGSGNSSSGDVASAPAPPPPS